MLRRKEFKENGDGFLLRDTIKRVGNIAHKVIYGRNDLSPKVKNNLRQVDDATITGMTIGRTKITRSPQG